MIVPTFGLAILLVQLSNFEPKAKTQTCEPLQFLPSFQYNVLETEIFAGMKGWSD